MDHIAHIKNTGGLDNESVSEETVSEHCKKTALLARSYSAPFNMESTVFVSALLHDLGKLNYDFDGYIKHENGIKRGEIDHSYAGAKFLLELVSNDDDKYKKEVARLIARIIISHHGLNDWYTRNNDDYFDYRCSKNERYDEIKSNISELTSDSELDELLNKAADEYRRFFEKMKEICCAKDRKQYFTTLAFYHGLLERLTESCLIDADRTATAEFMEGIKITEPSENEIQRNWLDMKQRLDNKLSKFSGSDSLISKLRMNISDRCCAFAKNDVGIVQLIVPTGGGKTLSALRFAIEYAVEHKKERIFYISPFMSILEQNGDVIREIAGDDNYLEHHSDMYSKIIDNKHKSKEEVADELEDYELRCRHWDKQVICTTMVQFFDTLFSSRTEALRRMHRFTDSVIIIDEVQSIPIRCIYLFNLAMNFLSEFMGCTIVLCSATQPTFEQCKYPIMLDKDSSMTGDYTKDFEDFKRTEVVSLLNNQGNTYEEAAVICMDKYRENGNLLFVVNTKTAAAEIFRKPTIIWVIDECRVMNKVSMERKGIRPIKYGGGNDLSYYTYLKDVEYRVRAHFEWNDNRPELEKDRNENKHHNIAKRMIQRGGRRDIFLGTRECMGYVEPCSYDEGVSYYQGTEIPYGFMYHGITYADEAEREEDKGKLTVRFWRPVMKDGVIKFDHPNDIPESQKRHIRDMKIKPFDKDLDNFSGLEEFDFIGGGDDIELD